MTIDGKTRVFGLFGDPVEHSLSPVLQNAGFIARGLNHCYLPFRVSPEKLQDAVRALPALNISGINVTAPHKENIFPLLDEHSAEALFLGAVNAVRNENGTLKGYNTDVFGFSFLLEKNVQRRKEAETVCLLGAGGAAKAVAFSLSHFPLQELTIANRTERKARELAELLIREQRLSRKHVHVVSLEKNALCAAMKRSTMIVHALSSEPFAWDRFSGAQLAPHCTVIDLRYEPQITPFLDWARNQGAAGINGLDMLLGQGLQAFEIFTGEKAPALEMEKALLAAVK